MPVTPKHIHWTILTLLYLNFMVFHMVKKGFKKKCSLFLNTSHYNMDLGDNCIPNIHLGRYIVGYTVGNLVLQRRTSGAVKGDFRTYIRRYTSPNENFEYVFPHSKLHFCSFILMERCKLHVIQ